MRVGFIVAALLVLAAAAAAAPLAAQTSADVQNAQRLEAARARAALVLLQEVQGVPLERRLPQARQAFAELQRHGPPDDIFSVAVARHLVAGALADGDLQEAERLARWRLRLIPALKVELRASGRPWTTIAALESSTLLWEANFHLGRALGDRRRWREALPFFRAALDLYLAGETGGSPHDQADAGAIALRMLLASTLENSGEPGLQREAVQQRMAEIRLRARPGGECSEAMANAIERLLGLPDSPGLARERRTLLATRVNACPQLWSRFAGRLLAAE